MTTPTHPALTWPRSDGHKVSLADGSPPTVSKLVMARTYPHNDAKYLLYEQKVAAYLAPKLKLPRAVCDMLYLASRPLLRRSRSPPYAST